jgi:hypothetical protein
MPSTSTTFDAKVDSASLAVVLKNLRAAQRSMPDTAENIEYLGSASEHFPCLNEAAALHRGKLIEIAGGATKLAASMRPRLFTAENAPSG